MDLNRYLRIEAYPRFIKRKFETIFGSIKDRIRLLKATPQLRDFDKLAVKIRQRLQPYYQKYVSEVSRDDMAVSLELSIFVTVMCEIFKPKSILDLGSGFSSLVFRLYMLDANPKPIIWSIDDSPEWLNKTREFLADNDLPYENLATWHSFIEGNRDKFDFILYDLGHTESRWKYLKKTLDLANSGGKIVLDDVHRTAYWQYAKRLFNESKLKYYNLRSFTKDNYGRYSALVSV